MEGGTANLWSIFLGNLNRAIFGKVYAKKSDDMRERGAGEGGYVGKISSEKVASKPPMKSKFKKQGSSGSGLTGSRTSGASDLDSSEESLLPSSAHNPGLLRHIHEHARRKMPLCFEGAFLAIQKNNTPNWLLSNSFTFSSVEPGGYKCMLSHTGDKNRGGNPYLFAEVAPSGFINFESRLMPTSFTKLSSVGQVAEGSLIHWEGIADLFLPHSTMSLFAVNGQYLALQTLIAVTKKLSLGVEMVVESAGHGMSSLCGALRWTLAHGVVSGTLGNCGLDLCYMHHVHPKLSVSTILEVGFKVRRALATVAYQYKGPGWTARGSVDSDGLVGALLERQLGRTDAVDLKAAVSAVLNHANNKFRLGFGVTATLL